ncbi:MAG: carbamoyltransferase HypF, partial [Actinobacteria bacterium]|nr:carbamoyltransferase HypF [Actinomycetota bacterium]
RPFIWKLFSGLGINGFVTNTTEGVYIELNAKNDGQLKKICEKIIKEKPEQSMIESINFSISKNKYFNDFKILPSLESEERFQLISPDIATCNKCIEDIKDIQNKRRYRYAFTNCTSCGPRFTIIKKMPYDRKNTTMAKFIMCPDCKKEYENPFDRRFHAQPNACIKCGPQLVLTDSSGSKINVANPIKEVSRLLGQGKIVAIKSLGGFQIACSAIDNLTVKKLRERKKRPLKPFAVMFKDMEMVKKYLNATILQQQSLQSPAAPVVLLKKKKRTHAKNNIWLAESISFYNKYEGAMLPYTPLHHLLFKETDVPLIMTSGNISEEPIASGNEEAINKLKNICDYFLIHDRDIYSKYDDSVLKIAGGKQMLIRRARGFAPYPIKLGIDVGNRVIFAAGANEKNTFCFLTKNYAILSQHIGDLDSTDAFDFYAATYKNYKEVFGFEKTDAIAFDKHPDYSSTRFANKSINSHIKIPVQHHKAHIASVIAENNLNKKTLAFSWDGTGLGDDGKIWGSEIFITGPPDNNTGGNNNFGNISFKRIGHLKEKILPGGEASIKNPYRMAIAYLYEIFKSLNNKKTLAKSLNSFDEYVFSILPFYKNIISTDEINILKIQIERGLNSPCTTSMGRFFDSVSSVLNLTHISSYEGEAAVHLENISDEKIESFYDFKLSSKAGYPKENSPDLLFEIDDFYIFMQVLKDIEKKVHSSIISSRFHNTLANMIFSISSDIRKKTGISAIILTGGVFQNSILIENIQKKLSFNGFGVYSNFKVPVNDGGISLGQAYIAAIELLNNTNAAIKDKL